MVLFLLPLAGLLLTTLKSCNRYVVALDTAGRQVPTSSEAKAVRLEEKIAELKVQMKEFQAIEIRLNDSPDKQDSLTDPDARSKMMRGTGIVGYNVQTAVDLSII